MSGTARIIITSGLRGFFAALVDDDGPIQSGHGSYATAEAAEAEALEWALAEDVPFVSATARSVSAVQPARGWYAGIGSRETPPDTLELMRQIGERLARSGFGLRSGAARGADTAFEQGADRVAGPKRIYVPWPNFEQRTDGEPGLVVAPRLPEACAAEAIAKAHHPAWDRLTQGMRKLHGRNAHEVLGDSLTEPVKFVIAWAPRPKCDATGAVVDVEGGTGTAVRIAASRGIPVFHLGIEAHRHRLQTWLALAPHDAAARDHA